MRNKIVFGIALGMIVLLFLGNQLYLFVQKKQWALEAEAVKRAYSETGLKQVERIEPFHGDESMTVIYGKDGSNREMIVWVGHRFVFSRYADEGVSREEIERKVLGLAPGATLLRVTPGILMDRLVWEAFYKVPEEKGYRYYYQYFLFEDGSPFDTYRLARIDP